MPANTRPQLSVEQIIRQAGASEKAAAEVAAILRRRKTTELMDAIRKTKRIGSVDASEARRWITAQLIERIGRPAVVTFEQRAANEANEQTIEARNARQGDIYVTREDRLYTRRKITRVQHRLKRRARGNRAVRPHNADARRRAVDRRGAPRVAVRNPGPQRSPGRLPRPSQQRSRSARGVEPDRLRRCRLRVRGRLDYPRRGRRPLLHRRPRGAAIPHRGAGSSHRRACQAQKVRCSPTGGRSTARRSCSSKTGASSAWPRMAAAFPPHAPLSLTR